MNTKRNDRISQGISDRGNYILNQIQRKEHIQKEVFSETVLFFVGCHQMIRIGVVELGLYFVFLKQIK